MSLIKTTKINNKNYKTLWDNDSQMYLVAVLSTTLFAGSLADCEYYLKNI